MRRLLVLLALLLIAPLSVGQGSYVEPWQDYASVPEATSIAVHATTSKVFVAYQTVSNTVVVKTYQGGSQVDESTVATTVDGGKPLVRITGDGDNVAVGYFKAGYLEVVFSDDAGLTWKQAGMGNNYAHSYALHTHRAGATFCITGPEQGLGRHFSVCLDYAAASGTNMAGDGGIEAQNANGIPGIPTGLEQQGWENGPSREVGVVYDDVGTPTLGVDTEGATTIGPATAAEPTALGATANANGAYAVALYSSRDAEFFAMPLAANGGSKFTLSGIGGGGSDVLIPMLVDASNRVHAIIPTPAAGDATKRVLTHLVFDSSGSQASLHESTMSSQATRLMHATRAPSAAVGSDGYLYVAYPDATGTGRVVRLLSSESDTHQGPQQAGSGGTTGGAGGGSIDGPTFGVEGGKVFFFGYAVQQAHAILAGLLLVGVGVVAYLNVQKGRAGRRDGYTLLMGLGVAAAAIVLAMGVAA